MASHIFSTLSHCHWGCPQGKVVGASPLSLFFSFWWCPRNMPFLVKLRYLLCFRPVPTLYPSTQKGQVQPYWKGRSLDQKCTLSQSFGCSPLPLSRTTFLPWGQQSRECALCIRLLSSWGRSVSFARGRGFMPLLSAPSDTTAFHPSKWRIVKIQNRTGSS